MTGAPPLWRSELYCYSTTSSIAMSLNSSNRPIGNRDEPQDAKMEQLFNCTMDER